jgi:hypothetical protein
LKKKLKEERKQKQMVKLSQDKLLMYMKEENLTILENLQEKSIWLKWQIMDHWDSFNRINWVKVKVLNLKINNWIVKKVKDKSTKLWIWKKIHTRQLVLKIKVTELMIMILKIEISLIMTMNFQKVKKILIIKKQRFN